MFVFWLNLAPHFLLFLLLGFPDLNFGWRLGMVGSSDLAALASAILAYG